MTWYWWLIAAWAVLQVPAAILVCRVLRISGDDMALVDATREPRPRPVLADADRPRTAASILLADETEALAAVAVKLVVTVAESAFREPVIERHVEVVDWRDGIDLADIDLRESIITEEEAALIRARRLAAMVRILEDQGYQVGEPEPDGRDDDG